MSGHSTTFLTLVNDARSRVREIHAREVPAELARVGNAKLIDVREDNEFAAGHIKGAEHLGKGVIERDIEARHPDKSTPLYLYCGGGFRSALAADNLQKMGYAHVVNIDGGWRELKEIMPVE
ncbi:rhodanese-like domain-containing protein [Hydrocarboniphaga sp.]|uniref:rhodanese-like domain-containing protein n=1 Tax=Hydrocarboniphaga sp. TaxID=2033016 RepID=UPI003D136442